MGWGIKIGKLYCSNHFAWWCGRGLEIVPSMFHYKENFVVTVPHDQLNSTDIPEMMLLHVSALLKQVCLP
jgi:hypothetical protein